MGLRTRATVAASALLAFASPASAAVILNFSGIQDTLTAGDNLTNDNGQFTSGTTPYLFLERTIVSGPTTQFVYLFHFDSPGNNGGDVADDFQIQLDPGTNLVSILPDNNPNLTAQDALFGVPGVIYPGPQADRGLEGNDVFSLGALAGNLQTIIYDLRGNGNNIDEVRFIVSHSSDREVPPPPPAVPEPATWAMMILGFGMVGGFMRRRQRQAGRFNLA